MDIKKILFKTSTIDVERALPDAVIYVSKDGKIQWVNDIAVDLFQTQKMHLLTSNISDFIETGINIITNTSSLNKSVIAKKTGEELYYDMTSREIDDGYVISLRKLSGNKSGNSDENTEVINREKNNFLVKLANDFKSPLQSIVGFSQAMSDGLGGNMSEQQEKYIKIINKNSTDLMYFITKLLEHAQTESSPFSQENKQFDIVSLINSVIKYNEQLFKDKEITITVKPDENFKKTVNTNPEALKLIFQDLLEVIFKSVDIGEVTISLSNPDAEYLQSKNISEGNYIHISISSNALLLSENDLECMFDPYRIVDSANRKNVLRAIVLSSVKNMLNKINGAIWVESEILRSTSFNVIIPEA